MESRPNAETLEVGADVAKHDIEANDLQPIKQLSPKLVILLGNIIEVNDSHQAKQPHPKLGILLGSVMLVNDLQL